MLLDSSVMEFNTDDLAFDPDRLRELSRRLMPDLPEEEYQKVCLGSRGWPAVLKFYSLARNRAGDDGDPEKLLSGYYARFFNKNVFDSLDSNACEFLIETSLLELLDEDLCEAVTGNPRAKNILQELASRNAFIRYDSKTGCYIHHPHFRNFLLDKLLSLQQSQIAALAHKDLCNVSSHVRASEKRAQDFCKVRLLTCLVACGICGG